MRGPSACAAYPSAAGGLTQEERLAMTAELSEELKREIRVGASTLDVLPELRDRVAHLVVFAGAAERAAKEVFALVERIREDEGGEAS